MKKFPDNLGNVSVVIGSQWGDEGKGKLIDILSEKYEVIARATGGANAGHTIYIPNPEKPGEQKKFVFHLVPSGMLNRQAVCVIGNGVVIHLATLFEELDLLEENGISTDDRIFISERAHLLFDYHKVIDGLQENSKGEKKVGTTRRGIGPCYTDKIRRNGIRAFEICDFEKFEKKYRDNLEMLEKMYGKFDYDVEAELKYYREIAARLKPMLKDTSHFLNNSLKEGKKILIEGANGTLLDVDHGTYPYVTSSNASIGGAITGTGIGATKITDVIGIMKAYVTRVGDGPFPTELKDALGEKIREQGGEYGATTGRPRRCGWFDAIVGRYTVMINGLTSINLTKLDVLSGLPSIKIAIDYKYHGKSLESFPADLDILENVEVQYIEMPGWNEDLSQCKNFSDLPENAQKYVQKLEELIDCKIESIGVGVGRDDIIFN